jgi:SAM-dependent methyltransferase
MAIGWTFASGWEGTAPMSTEHGDSIIALAKWLKTPTGRYAMSWETDQLDRLVADIFGYNAAQLGLLEFDTLRNNRMPFIFGVKEPIEGAPQDVAETETGESPARIAHVQRTTVIARLEELPFTSQSLDLIVLPHALEFADDPHEVLREVERVLIPEGQLIITGFNPTSLWGARQIVGRALDAPFLPRAGQFLRLARLKDWLKLLGFEVDRGRLGCYRPPLRSEKWLNRFGFLERAGDRWWPIWGSVYMVRAIKRVRGMRLVGRIWRDRMARHGALTPQARGTPVGMGQRRVAKVVQQEEA